MYFLKKKRHVIIIYIKKIAREQAKKYGCLVRNAETNEVLHYVEKPETFISDLISCGVYLFDIAVFDEIKKAMDNKKESNNSVLDSFATNNVDDRLSLERDLLRPLSESRKLYSYVTEGFWKQIKTAGSAISANAAYLELQYHENDTRLARNEQGGPAINGAVYIHPSAQIDPTSKVIQNHTFKHCYFYINLTLKDWTQCVNWSSCCYR